MRELIAQLATERPRRRSRRLRRASRAGRALDLRRLRPRSRSRTGGDPVERAFRRARTRPASSSSSATCPARWRPTRGRCCSSSTRRRASGNGVEAFAFGTRLTRVTPELDAPRPRARARGGLAARRRLVGRHAHRRLAEGVQRRVGPARAHPRRRRRHRLGRLGARGQGGLVGTQMARLARAGVRRRLGQPAQGQPGVRAARGRDARRPPATSTASCRGTTSPAWKRSATSSAASSGGTLPSGPFLPALQGW